MHFNAASQICSGCWSPRSFSFKIPHKINFWEFFENGRIEIESCEILTHISDVSSQWEGAIFDPL